jgi:hypothetical protein
MVHFVATSLCSNMHVKDILIPPYTVLPLHKGQAKGGRNCDRIGTRPKRASTTLQLSSTRLSWSVEAASGRAATKREPRLSFSSHHRAEDATTLLTVSVSSLCHRKHCVDVRHTLYGSLLQYWQNRPSMSYYLYMYSYICLILPGIPVVLSTILRRCPAVLLPIPFVLPVVGEPYLRTIQYTSRKMYV